MTKSPSVDGNMRPPGPPGSCVEANAHPSAIATTNPATFLIENISSPSFSPLVSVRRRVRFPRAALSTLHHDADRHKDPSGVAPCAIGCARPRDSHGLLDTVPRSHGPFLDRSRVRAWAHRAMRSPTLRGFQNSGPRGTIQYPRATRHPT